MRRLLLPVLTWCCCASCTSDFELRLPEDHPALPSAPVRAAPMGSDPSSLEPPFVRMPPPDAGHGGMQMDDGGHGDMGQYPPDDGTIPPGEQGHHEVHDHHDHHEQGADGGVDGTSGADGRGGVMR